MQLQSVLTTLVIMATTLVNVNGVAVPANQPDGVYTVDKNGEVLASGPLSQVKNVTPRAPAGFPGPVEVTCSGYMDPSATNDAVSDLESWCNSGGQVPGGEHAYAVRGGVVAYVCSYGGYNPCSSVEYSWAQDLWESNCGTTSGQGYVWISDWAKTYGQTLAGSGICENGAGYGFRIN